MVQIQENKISRKKPKFELEKENSGFPLTCYTEKNLSYFSYTKSDHFFSKESKSKLLACVYDF